MKVRDRVIWYLLTGLRAGLALIDLIAVFIIGFIATSVTTFLTSGSDPDRVITFAGLVLPAINAQNLPIVAMSVLALFLSKALASIFLTRRAAFLIARTEADAAKKIAETIFSKDLAAMRTLSREEITFAIQGGSPAAFPGLLNATNTLVTEGFLFLVVCLGFLLVDPWATLAAILYFGAIAATIHFFIGSKMTRAGEVSTQSTLIANTAISDLLSVFRELIVLRKREKYINALYSARMRAAESQATTYYLVGMPRYIIETALLVGLGLFVLVQGFSGDILSSSATVGVFLAGGFRLTGALLPLQSSLLTIKSTIPVAETAHTILMKSHSSITSHEDKREVRGNSTNEDYGAVGLKLDNISFFYDQSELPAIKNISLLIRPGSQIALIGPSGSGKSTIADLVCGVITPSSGQVIRYSANDNELGHEPIGATSYVPQRPGMVSGSILENVALGEEVKEIDRERVNLALGYAHLTSVIDALPHGLDTDLGKHRDSLSVGQIQRLGLARALYTNPGLLVVDETTSALDGESEAEIQKAIDGLKGKVTVIVIAHRLNTIQYADEVVLMSAGQLRDRGTFKELLDRNPSLERMVELMKVNRD